MIGHATSDTQRVPAGVEDLLVIADTFDDIEKARIAIGNRHQALTTEEIEGDKGGRYGKGIPASAPEAQLLADLHDNLLRIEHQAELELRRTMRRHPLGPWMKATIGIGDKQLARFLAAVGDPAERQTVSQLWAYCGLHVIKIESGADHKVSDAQPSSVGVAPSLTRGRKANWSVTAKTRAYLMAVSCWRQRRSPYRAVFDEAMAKHADAVHRVACKQCGPKGHPAPVGSPLSYGHKKARAMRATAKAIVKDIWIESRRANRPPMPSLVTPGGSHLREAS